MPRIDQIPCTSLKGVGPRLAQRLEKLGISTIQDLLFHLPVRYQDRTQVQTIKSLRQGDHAVIEGIITETDIKYGRRASLLSQLQDATGGITLRFFHFTAAQRQRLAIGQRLRCYGEVRFGYSGYEMVHPEYFYLTQDESIPVEQHLTPIYPATEGVNQLMLRKLTEQALQYLNDKTGPVDFLPVQVLQPLQLPNLHEAVRYLQRPPPRASLAQLENGKHPAQLRLAFEELLAHQLSLRRLRQRIQLHQAPSLIANGELKQQFLRHLSFKLTNAQQRVIDEVSNDLIKPYPMMRLLQGDVGSGKTVVSALAALQALESGYQVAIMAPTEILAEQHFNNFSSWLAPLAIDVAWLSGSSRGKSRDETLEKIMQGKAHLIIGTHALFQKDVQFQNLGLIVVDEQHRFGVEQRLALQQKGVQSNYYPHQLIMTATPIPRTLAMSAYADLDSSIIDELPPGRSPVTTIVVADQRRHEVISRVHENCQQGKQVYWVCTLIDESEILQCQAAEETCANLKNFLPDLKVGLLHGRMKPKEKEEIMSQFKKGEIQLLVATTVIEVGVDVPNASLMVIENAERLGLAQLHQLRGRVGRGVQKSYCVLLYKSPLSFHAKQRLATLRDTNDGFVIAQKDLQIRGPGDVLGTRQTGLLQLKIADLMRDKHLLSSVQKAAEILLRDHPDCIDSLIRRWLVDGEKFAAV